MEYLVDESLLTIEDFKHITPLQDMFINAFYHNTYAHAYLVSGQEGVGKYALCHRLAQLVVGNHLEDYLEISLQMANESLGTKSSSIGVGAVRQCIVPFVSMQSMFNGTRVVLIREGHLLTEQAQNALLKSIEEPQGKVLFFILTQDSTKIITTIKSRCQKISLQPWSVQKVEDYLLRFSLPKAQAQQIASLSGGILGEAIAFAQNETTFSQIESILQSALQISTLPQAVQFACLHAKMSNTMQDVFLNKYETIVNQAIKKANGLPTTQTFPTFWEENIIYKAQTFVRIQNHIIKAREMKNSQVTWHCVLDYMLFHIVEELAQWR